MNNIRCNSVKVSQGSWAAKVFRPREERNAKRYAKLDAPVKILF